jgi:hypothetical protein
MQFWFWLSLEIQTFDTHSFAPPLSCNRVGC